MAFSLGAGDLSSGVHACILSFLDSRSPPSLSTAFFGSSGCGCCECHSFVSLAVGIASTVPEFQHPDSSSRPRLTFYLCIEHCRVLKRGTSCGAFHKQSEGEIELQAIHGITSL